MMTKLEAVLIWGSLIGIGVAGGIVIGTAKESFASSSSPSSPTALILAPADVAFAKEHCRRRGLSWSRFELALDGTHVDVYCASEEIVRAQLEARWREIRSTATKK